MQASQVSSPLPVKPVPPQLPAPDGAAPPPPAAPLLPPVRTKSRKEKSLGVLCASFMALFKDAPPNRNNNGTVIDLVGVAEHLGVKRRRIYDVINILEAIDVVARVKKNTYRWHGTCDMPRYFAELQKDGVAERDSEQAALAVAAVEAAEGGGGGAAKKPPTPAKTKGMSHCCQKLVQIFLVSGRTEIGLHEAAEEVLGPLTQAEEANQQKAMKTKVRRMYDIANVLQSIGIVQKENVGSTSVQNKPSFRWVYKVPPSDMHQYLTMPRAGEDALQMKMPAPGLSLPPRVAPAVPDPAVPTTMDMVNEAIASANAQMATEATTGEVMPQMTTEETTGEVMPEPAPVTGEKVSVEL